MGEVSKRIYGALGEIPEGIYGELDRVNKEAAGILYEYGRVSGWAGKGNSKPL